MDQISVLFHLLLVDPMTNVLVAFAHVFGGNFGIAIIVFTLLTKFITWPLTSSQLKSSRAMQAMQPKLQELQKKYKGKDPKKMQAEQMALYREAGVNPLGCIFPMLVQMPIWIALYQVIRLSLGTAPESLVTLSQRLYPVPFIHNSVPLTNTFLFWDLGQNDTTFILPLLVAGTMYVQQKMMTPAPSAATSSNSTASQQQQTAQMMTWMMPLMFGFYSLNVPAGLALYWFVSNLSGVVLQYFYMGRKVDWKSMLSFNPAAAPAPAVRSKAQVRAAAIARAGNGASGNGASQTDVSDGGDDDGDGMDLASEADVNEDGAPVMVTGSAAARRKRNGRRRGKR